MKVVVLNVGVGTWHPRGSSRLNHSLQANQYDGDVMLWTDGFPPDSPTHKQANYAFKAFAFKWAKEKGYDIAIWMDSSIYLKKSLQPIIDLIAKDGHFIIRNGWTASDWLCDNQIECLGITREQAKEAPLIIAGAMGFNLNDKKIWAMLEKWIEYTKCFSGEWTNTGICSQDDSVLGSRHDQSFMSVLAYQNNLTLHNPQGYLSYNVNDDVILAAQGM